MIGNIIPILQMKKQKLTEDKYLAPSPMLIISSARTQTEGFHSPKPVGFTCRGPGTAEDVMFCLYLYLQEI